MDLLANSRIYSTITAVDQAASTTLTDFVESSVYQNPTFASYLVDGYGGVGGKMTIRIKYRLLQSTVIERMIVASFTTDTGQMISTRSMVSVDQIS